MNKLSHPLPRYPIEKQDESLPSSPPTEPVLVHIPSSPYDSVTLVEVLEDIGPSSSDEQDSRPMLQAEAGETIQVLERWTGDKWKGLRLKDNSTGFFLLDGRVVGDVSYGAYVQDSLDLQRPLLTSRVYVLWDHVTEGHDDISLSRGESVEVFDKKGSWWFLGGSENDIGLIPFNYVVRIAYRNDRARYLCTLIYIDSYTRNPFGSNHRKSEGNPYCSCIHIVGLPRSFWATLRRG